MLKLCCRFVSLSALVAVSLSFASNSPAQLDDLDQLGQQFATELQPFKPTLIAVADLTPLGGTVSAHGHYFSMLVTGSLQYHAKEKLLVSDHADFDAAFSKTGFSTLTLASHEALRVLHHNVIQDVILIGSVRKDSGTYQVEVTAVRVSDGTVLVSHRAVFQPTAVLDSLTEPFPPPMDGPVYRPGVDPVGTPSCVYCPLPLYSDLASRCRMQGSAVIDVVISPQGTTVAMRPKQFLGCGLDEQAFKIVKTWTFKPAMQKDGTPVYAVIPVELKVYPGR